MRPPQKRWLDAARPCKLGTIPAVVHLHGKDDLREGNWVRVKECLGGKWSQVYVTKVHDNGYFKANR